MLPSIIRRMRKGLAILLFAFAASAADIPRYWSVHVDFTRDRAAYEKGDAQCFAAQSEFYSSHHVTPPNVIRLSTAGGAYYFLSPRGSLSDFEKPNPLGEAVTEMRTRTAAVCAPAHQTLRAHHSEIWQIDRELTNIGGHETPKYVLMRTDFVLPPNDASYATATKQLIREAVDRGIGVAAFVSVFGDGSHRYLFMSEEPLKIRTLGGLAETHDAVARWDRGGF
jgi:hypothetical protein